MRAATCSCRGHDGIRALYGALFAQSPDLHAEIVNRIRVGEYVIDEERTRGINFDGFPAGIAHGDDLPRGGRLDRARPHARGVKRTIGGPDDGGEPVRRSDAGPRGDLRPRAGASRRAVRPPDRLRGAAEDLAQETLTEAWRNPAQAARPERRGPLAVGDRPPRLRAVGIRARGRDLTRHAARDGGVEREPSADDLDLAVELERDDLARLLDRALAHLPVETRAALVARYVEGSPQAQVALRLGLSEGAVAMRLRRGKLALRRLLATELRDEAAAYGLAGGDDGRWEDARLWCPVCGRHRLAARLLRATGELTLRCPGCTPAPDGHISRATMPLLHRDSTTARAGSRACSTGCTTPTTGSPPAGWCAASGAGVPRRR